MPGQGPPSAGGVSLCRTAMPGCGGVVVELRRFLVNCLAFRDLEATIALEPLNFENTTPQALERSLRAMVTALARMGSVLPRLLLTQKIMQKGPGLPAGLKKGRLGQCYRNAGQNLFGTNEKLVYCEGYAVSSRVGLPMMHAWLVNEKGEVLDPTWPEEGAYLGLPFKHEYCLETWEKSGVWGLWAEYVPKQTFEASPWDIFDSQRLQPTAAKVEAEWESIRSDIAQSPRQSLFG